MRYFRLRKQVFPDWVVPSQMCPIKNHYQAYQQKTSASNVYKSILVRREMDNILSLLSRLCPDQHTQTGVVVVMWSSCENWNLVKKQNVMWNRAMRLRLIRGSAYTAKVKLRLWLWLLWNERFRLLGAMTAFIVLIRAFLYFWFVSLPPKEATFLCSFGKGTVS